MAEVLILEFEGFGRDTYEAVNAQLGIDPETGEGDWPDGLEFHAGGATPNGWAVLEVWASKDSQQQFMDGRLGAALGASGVTAPPTRAEWLENPTVQSPG
jgi:hypothetical protein